MFVRHLVAYVATPSKHLWHGDLFLVQVVDEQSIDS